MNRRNQEIVSDEALVAHLKKNYTYDATRGKLVRRETGRLVKGSYMGRYMSCDIRKGSRLIHFLYHRAVWAVAHGYLPMIIDHINGDKTDNRLCNLREVSASENNKNVIHPWRPNARTGLPGVYEEASGFRIKNSSTRFFFRDKYEAFHALILLGRMFKEE